MKFIATYDQYYEIGDTIEKALESLADNVGCDMDGCEVYELGKQIQFEVKSVVVLKPVITNKKVSK